MPAFKLNSFPAIVDVWYITESLNKLLDSNTKAIQSQSLKYKNETHRKQFLAKHLLLKELNLTSKVSYLSNGKPVLSNGQYISISHSGPFVVIAVWQEPVGIDIEKNQPKLKKIANRFISDEDYYNQQLNNELHWLWTAKESIYKLAGIRGLSFKNDIIIRHLNINCFSGKAIMKNKKVDLVFKKIDDDYLLCMAYYVKTLEKS